MKEKSLRKVRQRLGFAKPYLDDFVDWLRGRRYTDRSIQNHTYTLARWAEWAERRRFGIETMEEALATSESFFKNYVRSRRKRNPNEELISVSRLFIQYLRDSGVVSQPPKPLSAADRWPCLADFRCWMHQHRGVMESSLDLWQRHITKLLETLGDDASLYTAKAVRGFVLKRAESGGRARAGSITCAVRAYLRYLAANGQCPSGLQYAVPRIAHWQLSSVPKYLSGSEVDRIIQACQGHGWARDKAIILLLARLGLRSSDVAALRLCDIDWSNARIAVSGKSRRAQWLPLTQEIGEAILDYLKQNRPHRGGQSLFLTSLAPRRPITRMTVKCVVKRALIRAKVESASKGAHVLRHTAATAMLSQGVSLAGVGAVLRHGSSLTTVLYAKVNLGKLSDIAQPWVGRLPC
jgi:integrase/recombinase XerD